MSLALPRRQDASDPAILHRLGLLRGPPAGRTIVTTPLPSAAWAGVSWQHRAELAPAFAPEGASFADSLEARADVLERVLTALGSTAGGAVQGTARTVLMHVDLVLRRVRKSVTAVEVRERVRDSAFRLVNVKTSRGK